MNYTELAEEAIKRYNLDPQRVARAVNIIENKTIVLAKIDEDGNAITPSRAAYAVKSPAHRSNDPDGCWYIVRPESKTCQCYDSHAGNICKHRIAVYLYQELPRRQFAELTQKQPTPAPVE